MKYSICLEPILQNYDFYDRIKIAADLGFDGIEFWEPNFDMERIGRLAAQNHIQVAGCCMLNQWSIVLTSDAGKVVKNLEETIDFVSGCGCNSLLAMGGSVNSRGDSQKLVIIDNLKRMAEVAERRGVNIYVEPLNSYVDHKGYYLDSAHVGYEIIRCVGSERVKLLYDCYHMQIMEGNLIETLTGNLNHTGHIHVACVPGRNEPHIGEINYPNIMKSVKKAGYDRFVGLEYWPTYDDMQSLADSLACIKNI